MVYQNVVQPADMNETQLKGIFFQSEFLIYNFKVSFGNCMSTLLFKMNFFCDFCANIIHKSHFHMPQAAKYDTCSIAKKKIGNVMLFKGCKKNKSRIARQIKTLRNQNITLNNRAAFELNKKNLFFKNELFRNLKAKNERNKIAFLQSFGYSNSFFYLISSAFSQPNIKIDTRAVE